MTPPADGMYVRDAAGLEALCERIRGAPVVALDTEFVGENSYYPLLEVVQVGIDGFAALIDFQAVPRLDPLFPVLHDPAVEKVFHAGSQDLEIFLSLAGKPVTPVFDTQVGAAMVGYGPQIGYAKLVEQITRRHLKKSQTVTDWSRRPLTPAQISYALDDVRHLLPVHRHLVDRLKRMGRLEWIREELTRLERPETFAKLADRETYRRVSGGSLLEPRELAILRELAAWREGEARARNSPRQRIVSDDVLVEVARNAPRDHQGLQNFRRLWARDRKRYGDELLQAVERGMACPESELPERRRAPRTRVAPGVIDLLEAFLRSRAERDSMSPSMLATKGDLQALIDDPRGPAAQELPILNGWRRTMAGEDVLAILEGRMDLGVDAKSGEIRLRKIQGE